MQPHDEFQKLQPNVVLAVAAHPDDMDFGSGGTLATFAKQGAAVYYMQLTDGGKGSPDTDITSAQLVQTRQAEQRAACEVIGGKGVTFLDHPDGTLEVTMELKQQIVAEIRRLKPDVVITTDPTMVYAASFGIINHPDHRAAGQATLDAVYPLARDHLSFPSLLAQGLEPHKVKTVLMNNFESHNFYIDISDVLDTKLAAAAAHASQVANFDGWRDRFTIMAKAQGKRAGYQYAEGFVRLDIV